MEVMVDGISALLQEEVCKDEPIKSLKSLSKHITRKILATVITAGLFGYRGNSGYF